MFSISHRSLMWQDLRITINEQTLILIGIGVAVFMLLLVLAVLCICCICNFYRATELDLKDHRLSESIPINSQPTGSSVIEMEDNNFARNIINQRKMPTPKQRIKHRKMSSSAVSHASNFSICSQQLEVGNLIGKLKQRQLEREQEYQRRSIHAKSIRSRNSKIHSKSVYTNLPLHHNMLNNPVPSQQQFSDSSISTQIVNVEQKAKKNPHRYSSSHSSFNNQACYAYQAIPTQVAAPPFTQYQIQRHLQALQENNKQNPNPILYIINNNANASNLNQVGSLKCKKKSKKKKRTKKKKITRKDFLIIDKIYQSYCLKYNMIPVNAAPLIRYCHAEKINIPPRKLNIYMKKRKSFEKRFIEYLNRDSYSVTQTLTKNGTRSSVYSLKSPNDSSSIDLQVVPYNKHNHILQYGDSVSSNMTPSASTQYNAKLPELNETIYSTSNTKDEKQTDENKSVIISKTPKPDYKFGVPIKKAESTSAKKVNPVPIVNLLEKMGWSYHSDTESYIEAANRKKMDPNYVTSISSQQTAHYYNENAPSAFTKTNTNITASTSNSGDTDENEDSEDDEDDEEETEETQNDFDQSSRAEASSTVCSQYHVDMKDHNIDLNMLQPIDSKNLSESD